MVPLQPGVAGLRACSLSLASVRTEWQKYRTRVREGDDVLRAFFTLLGGGHAWEHRLSCERAEVEDSSGVQLSNACCWDCLTSALVTELSSWAPAVLFYSFQNPCGTHTSAFEPGFVRVVLGPEDHILTHQGRLPNRFITVILKKREGGTRTGQNSCRFCVF